MGKHQLAAGDWEEGFGLAPENASYPAQIAMAYKNLEDYGEAERYYLVAIKLEPQNSRLRQQLESVINTK